MSSSQSRPIIRVGVWKVLAIESLLLTGLTRRARMTARNAVDARTIRAALNACGSISRKADLTIE